MDILFLTSRAPFPPVGGDRLRAFHFIKALSRKHRVTLLCFAGDEAEAEEVQPMSNYVDHLEVVRLDQRRSYLNCLMGLFSRKPLQVHYYRSTAMRKLIRYHLSRRQFDLIFVHLIRMADYINDMNGLPKIMDLTDAISLNYERSAACEPQRRLTAYNLAQRVERRRVREYESSMLRRFDCNVLISPVDRDYLAGFTPVDNVRVIGPGVNLKYFEYYEGGYDPDTIIFHGKMSTFPNQDAVLYFYERIFPLILQHRPAMRLYFVGIEPGPEIQAMQEHPNVTVTGYVPDVRPFIRQAALSICPMRTGAGAKNKVLESMAMGTPVVATPMGVEGIDLVPGRHALIGNNAAELASLILDLAREPRRRRELARNGRMLIEQKYDWGLVFQQVNALVESFKHR